MNNANQSERFNREVGSVSSFNTENKTQITLEEQVDQILFCAWNTFIKYSNVLINFISSENICFCGKGEEMIE